MGTQWRGMGLSLMRLDSFRESILRSDEAVKPLGVKVSDLLLSTDERTFDDIVHAFVSLTAIQVRHLRGAGTLGHSCQGPVLPSAPESHSPGPVWCVSRALYWDNPGEGEGFLRGPGEACFDRRAWLYS